MVYPPAMPAASMTVTACGSPLGHDQVELKQEGLDPLRGVDDDHRDGQVLGEAEQPGGVDLAGRPEALDAAQHRRAGQPGLVRPTDDLGVERLVVALVGLAARDRESLRGPCRAISSSW